MILTRFGARLVRDNYSMARAITSALVAVNDARNLLLRVDEALVLHDVALTILHSARNLLLIASNMLKGQLATASEEP